MRHIIIFIKVKNNLNSETNLYKIKITDYPELICICKQTCSVYHLKWFNWNRQETNELKKDLITKYESMVHVFNVL